MIIHFHSNALNDKHDSWYRCYDSNDRSYVVLTFLSKKLYCKILPLPERHLHLDLYLLSIYHDEENSKWAQNRTDLDLLNKLHFHPKKQQVKINKSFQKNNQLIIPFLNLMNLLGIDDRKTNYDHYIM